jgi:hypothetical protein
MRFSNALRARRAGSRGGAQRRGALGFPRARRLARARPSLPWSPCAAWLARAFGPLLLSLALALAGCGGKAPQSAAPAALQLPPLPELIPPGPSPLVLVRPRALFEREEAKLLWTTLVAPSDEQEFVQRTGVDPRTLEELVVFEVGKGGYLLLARGPFSAKEVVLRAADRLALRDVEADEPVLRREGLTGNARYSYARLDEHALLVAKNASPALVANVLAHRTDRSLPHAFQAPEAQALYRSYAGAPCALLAPLPLDLELGSGVALLLAKEQALAATARPIPGAFRIEIDLRGEFPSGAEHNFRTLALSVAQSPLGQVLGLTDIEQSLVVQSAASGVRLAFDWSAQRLAHGLRTLFLDDLRSLTR